MDSIPRQAIVSLTLTIGAGASLTPTNTSVVVTQPFEPVA